MTKAATRIDVLALYPKASFAFPTSEVGVINFAHDSIAVANDIFTNSNANTPPTASFTVSCAGGTCTFNASASSDNAPIPAGGYHWDFGDGTTGTGKIVNHTYTFGSFFWVHLVVTDSGGQRGFTLKSVQP